jgi:hypothetical protein
MNSGASPVDITIVVTFCGGLYRKCRDAGGEYNEISHEVQGVYYLFVVASYPCLKSNLTTLGNIKICACIRIYDVNNLKAYIQLSAI